MLSDNHRYQEKLVSCVVIFFNAKKSDFFEQAIDSILNQTYEHTEVILADDGSTDGSTEIALDYLRRYPDKVRYVDHQNHCNLGMSATRNLGIRHSAGEYIAFLDADDVWLPNKLEEQVDILLQHPEAMMLYGRTKYWFSWMENNPTLWKLDEDAEPGDFLTITSKFFDALIEPPMQLLSFLQNTHVYPCTCSVLIRKNVFNELGMFEEEFQGAHEDMVMHSKIFLNCKVYVSSQCWDFYRMHEDSFWRSADRVNKGEALRVEGRIKYLLWLEQYLIKNKINNPSVWREVRACIRPYRYPLRHKLLVRIRRLCIMTFKSKS